MQAIQIKENQKEIWNKFIAENNSESFLQAWEWGEFQKSIGKKIFRIGVVDDNFEENNKKVTSDDLLAVALLIEYNLPFEQSYLYCPRGPVVKASGSKYPTSSILDFLFEEIKKLAKEEKALFLKIDPPAEMNQESKTPPLKKGAGGILKKSPNEIQPKNTLILNLTKSAEELLKEMKPKTRYNIRLAERKGVKIESWRIPLAPPLSRGGQWESFKKNFEKFWELVKETSARDKFSSHHKNYYRKMLENLSKKHLPENPSIPLSQRGNSQERNNLYCLQAKLYLAEYQNKIIAANVVLSFGDFCVYLHGASANNYRNAMAPYLLQWRQILDEKKTGRKIYDFWGIAESQKLINGEKNKSEKNWGGITRFKKGFGGEEKNYSGAYDLVFNNWKYRAYQLFRKIRNF